ncbi:hypothetical protein [Pleionea litopenaei]|uniref:Uncharacterized protein n=1 Tax=Pleionea litopenaei TaxID=3070815 RepID=A0AA51X622_9GAMM|nr:hypothetical protein [Pleionea sp. HL-JVS1]WMS86827.1 hypothetical protein Q9312_16525 [Pleionea sp. HL-JVS1]
MKKFGIMLAIVFFCGGIMALPKYAKTKYYYSDSSRTTLVGMFVSGCGVNTIHFKGERTDYMDMDPVIYDCGQLGNLRFSSDYGRCFRQHSFSIEDEDENGYIDGYRNLHECTYPLWYENPFDNGI